MNLDKLSLQGILSELIKRGFDYTRNSRECPELSDYDFILLGCERVLSQVKSGREFLQKKSDMDEINLAISTFFDALHSERRKDLSIDIEQAIRKQLSKEMDELGVDYLKDFPELNGYEIFAADGHCVKAASHTKTEKVSKKEISANTIYAQDLRNGLYSVFCPVSHGSIKSHEMPPFRKQCEDLIGKDGKKKVFVLDRAYCDKTWWSEMQFFHDNKIHFVSRTKSNFTFNICGETPIDTTKDVNTGVKRDFVAGIGSNSATFRVVDYEDPETGIEYQFISSLKDKKIPPGLIAWLYFKRWTIEKGYDSKKNALSEKKAWATGFTALHNQGNFICIIMNILRFLHEKNIDKMNDDEIALKDKKYQKSLADRSTKAQNIGRKIHPFLQTLPRIAQIPLQFIRLFRNCFCENITLEALYPRFRKRLINFAKF